MTGTPAELAGAAAWLRGQGLAIAADASVRRLGGGRSNLTYAVRDAAGAEVVLRRPPTGQLLATAHDVVREARIMAAEPTDARHALQSAPTAAPGFASRAALVERYAARATVDLEPLPYYLAFSYWKLACIVSGVHHRLVQAAAGPAPAEADAYASQVVRLAELAHDALPPT